MQIKYNKPEQIIAVVISSFFLIIFVLIITFVTSFASCLRILYDPKGLISLLLLTCTIILITTIRLLRKVVKNENNSKICFGYYFYAILILNLGLLCFVYVIYPILSLGGTYNLINFVGQGEMICRPGNGFIINNYWEFYLLFVAPISLISIILHKKNIQRIFGTKIEIREFWSLTVLKNFISRFIRFNIRTLFIFPISIFVIIALFLYFRIISLRYTIEWVGDSHTDQFTYDIYHNLYFDGIENINHTGGEGEFYMPDADFDSFSIISQDGSYAKDSNDIFYESYTLREADLKTFGVKCITINYHDYCFGYDKSRVYWQNYELKGISPVNLTVLSDHVISNIDGYYNFKYIEVDIPIIEKISEEQANKIIEEDLKERR